MFHAKQHDGEDDELPRYEEEEGEEGAELPHGDVVEEVEEIIIEEEPDTEVAPAAAPKAKAPKKKAAKKSAPKKKAAAKKKAKPKKKTAKKKGNAKKAAKRKKR
jgi:hypothetical protein